MSLGNAIVEQLGQRGVGGATPSAVMLLTALAHRHAWTFADGRRIQGSVRRNDHNVFHIESYREAHGHAFGFPSRFWRDSVGASLLGDVEAGHILVGEFRYCQDCLSQGWHTAMFQHLSVGACPVHGCGLRVGCIECGSPIPTSTNSFLEHHNFCWSCGYPFVLTGSLESCLSQGVEQPEAFQRLYDALLPRAQACNFFRLDHPAARYRHEALRIHRVSIGLHRSWPLHRGTALRMISESLTPRFGATLKYAERHELAVNERAQAVWQLQEQIEAVGGSCSLLPELNHAHGGGVRITRPMHLTAVALARTAVQLGRPKEIWERGHLWLGSSLPTFVQWLPQDAAGAAYAARYQVYKLFALNLLRIRSLRWIEEVPWNEQFEPAAFSAPWRHVEVGGEAMTEFRCRMSLAGALRLIRRYGDRLLPSKLEQGGGSVLDALDPMPNLAAGSAWPPSGLSDLRARFAGKDFAHLCRVAGTQEGGG
ncbi:hypothetical protein [Hydrogenophaga sp.]|uniref:hypothetical protein n=1 Tax=Hydrogenophaga sp. TaxID=1904254 RepID=UPI0025BADD0E|nr:hypothetical protein [Hydrogenophaga sp.]